ncbi:hypothetical protein P4O66_003393 [Electrophorus voltai]|uniref:Uncharacterized protein n=1 Tax=Electrophorus voltai TaxID=2609070 RepID=A0AAD8YQ48_9TELE|nr:hypothetical protein P4O66_003393 [Electrophorus voltai]
MAVNVIAQSEPRVSSALMFMCCSQVGCVSIRRTGSLRDEGPSTGAGQRHVNRSMELNKAQLGKTTCVSMVDKPFDSIRPCSHALMALMAAMASLELERLRCRIGSRCGRIRQCWQRWASSGPQEEVEYKPYTSDPEGEVEYKPYTSDPDGEVEYKPYTSDPEGEVEYKLYTSDPDGEVEYKPCTSDPDEEVEYKPCTSDPDEEVEYKPCTSDPDEEVEYKPCTSDPDEEVEYKPCTRCGVVSGLSVHVVV